MENISINPNHQQKRKLHDQQSNPNNPPSSLDSPIQTSNERNSPAYKRQRMTAASAPLSANPTKGMVNSSPQPRIIDLTRGSNFEPHKGAKRLVVKNLKAASSQNVDDYYNKVWKDLDGAVTSIFGGEQTSSPLEVLCRGVEATCRRGRAHDLYLHLRDHSKEFMDKVMLPQIQGEIGAGSIGALLTVHKYWKVWHKQTARINPIFYCTYVQANQLADSHPLHIQLSR